MAFYTHEQLQALGFKSLGANVLISDKASIYGAGRIEIGNNVRIDDFCILSAGKGGIKLGNYIHIACYSSLIGQEEIFFDDFSGLSSRVSIYSSSDDYSGRHLTNPTVPEQFTNVIHGKVKLGKHVIIGVGATVLPGVTIGDGSAIGAYALVNKSIAEGLIAAGVPAKEIKKRDQAIFELEAELAASKNVG